MPDAEHPGDDFSAPRAGRADTTPNPDNTIESGAPAPGIDALVERLATHRTVGPAPREELAWMAKHGELQLLSAGHTVSTPSLPVAGMYVLLAGRVSIHLLRGNTRHKVAEWTAGDVTGILPYSRLTAAPGDTIVEESAEVLLVPRQFLPEMARHCHELTTILVHVMLDRARFFNSTMLHDEKLKSLGKLAAGLAHELNNPAAAISRFAKMLPDALAAAESASQALGAAGLTEAEEEAVKAASVASLSEPLQQVRSPIEESEREDAIANWLEGHGLDADRSEILAQSPVTVAVLDRLAGFVRPEVLGTVLGWVASDSSVRGLAKGIDQAGTRISDLVTAVRGFSRVDTALVPQPVDVAEGLAQTVAVLQGKARGKAIRIAIDVEEGIPPARGVAAELNQIWLNLIDNALDAVPKSGRVEVTARHEKNCVVVRLSDNGPGIPAEIRDRIFDPFFTTKDVGKGTGLGLDIARRLVDRHDGDIEVQSRPGRTEFIVRLPLADLQVHEGGA